MEYEFLRADLLYVTQKKERPEGVAMVDVLTRLDEVARRPDLPERLEHYLSKRSYVKALEWLDDPELPHRV